MDEEKEARIRNLNADTELKIAQLRMEKVKVAISFIAAAAALFGVAAAIIKGH